MSHVAAIVAQAGHGTAFFIGADLWLTCAHTLSSPSSDECALRVWLGHTTEAAEVIADVCAVDFDADLALLRTAETHNKLKQARLDIVSQPGGARAEDTMAYGYGGTRTETPFYFEWHAQQQANDHSTTGFLELKPSSTTGSLAGLSGAPLIGKDTGCFYGVFKEQLKRDTAEGVKFEPHARAIPAATVRQFLRSTSAAAALFSKEREGFEAMLCHRGEESIKALKGTPGKRRSVVPAQLHFRIIEVKEQSNFDHVKMVLKRDLLSLKNLASCQLWSTLGRYELIVRYRISGEKEAETVHAAIGRVKEHGGIISEALDIIDERASALGFDKAAQPSLVDMISIESMQDLQATPVFIFINYSRLPYEHNRSFVDNLLQRIKSDRHNYSVSMLAGCGESKLLLELLIPCGRLRSLSHLSTMLADMASRQSEFGSPSNSLSKETLLAYEAFDLVEGKFKHFVF